MSFSKDQESFASRTAREMEAARDKVEEMIEQSLKASGKSVGQVKSSTVQQETRRPAEVKSAPTEEEDFGEKFAVGRDADLLEEDYRQKGHSED